jgi:hypothetical protein
VDYKNKQNRQHAALNKNSDRLESHNLWVKWTDYLDMTIRQLNIETGKLSKRRSRQAERVIIKELTNNDVSIEFAAEIAEIIE